MVKSPWSSSLRQKRCTSGAQAFSSWSVPLCARAPGETGMESKMSAKNSLCIVFLPSDRHSVDRAAGKLRSFHHYRMIALASGRGAPQQQGKGGGGKGKDAHQFGNVDRADDRSPGLFAIIR